MNPKTDVPYERAIELFCYDEETGDLSWRKDSGRYGRIKAGTKVGTVCTSGHMQVRVDGRLRFVHRICFTIANKKVPSMFVDHINGIKTDNRAVNLRDVSKSENNQNLKKAMGDSVSGLLGVAKNGSGWKALISNCGRQRYLGTFKTKEEAHAVYLAEKRATHAGCTI